MLTRMSVGIFLAFIVTVSKVIIFVIERSHPDINNFGKLLFIPQTIQSLSFILVYPVSLEFTVAQSPVHMRGVMVGLWYATAWGLDYLINTTLKFPFDCESQYICTSFYYYITKSVLVLIILIVFVILAKRYKYRVRENEVNIVQIVDDHYQRYMNQREQFGSDTDILVLLWNYLMFAQYFLISRFIGGSSDEIVPTAWYRYGFVFLTCSGWLSFPFLGLLADVWIGRYKAILIGIVLCFISWIIIGIGFIVDSYLASKTVLYSIYSFACVFQFSASGVSASLVLVSHSFFKHKLENISLIKNPIKLIVRVLCYARKHKYPENRSALTYWEEEAPSRLDLGKDKYGGPFTEEEVEDVKTIFRMLPLFIGFVAIGVSDDYYWSAVDSFTLPTCFAVTDSIYSLCLVILIVCFYKYIPSMLTRMSVGIFLAFIATVSKVIIFVIERSHPDINNFVSLEFTVAQSPVHMRGVMVGLWYATAWGLGYLINTTLKFPFDCESQYICTSFYYYITKSVLVLIILIVFVILAKRYKYRVRENEVNIVQIVDDHYQRYLNQREQFGSDTDSDFSILVLLWNFLIYTHYFLFSRFTGIFATEAAPATWYNFTANIIQYNIDQLVGASADELNFVIYWHMLSEPLVASIFYLLQCLFYSTSGVSVSLVLVSHSFLKHKLENISLIKNPIKLIVRVLCYARKHKYPENRSALTYWEEEAPSRLDLGKDKYGGPFTEEEVEDVKTVFRMLPLFIGFLAFILSDDTYWSAVKSFTLTTCLAVTDSHYRFCSVILIVCFYKYIPSMLTRMSVGIFLAFIVIVSKVIIFVIDRSHPDISSFVSLEFTVAQSPVHMRGVMVGLWYACWGIGLFINFTVKFPFACESQYIYTSFYYYITKSVLVLIILIVFVILAKRYKFRVRENEVNIVQIVDDHYQRYMEQEERNGHDSDEFSILSY
uniref:Uncharacterized protein n=1 Tax=Amphimedon queenslandica TaxID=400682 RepID=A0A1X7UPV9_AMPQE